MASIGSTSISTEAGVSTPTMIELSMPTANTEYTFVFPANTKEYWFVNWGTALVEYGYVSGGIFMPLNLKEAREKLKLKLPGILTIYFKSAKADQLVKIEYWT